MKICTSILAMFLCFCAFGQKKKECRDSLNSFRNNFSGQWKFVYAEFSPTKQPNEPRKYPDHILVIEKSRFSVKRHTDSIPYQTGKLKIKKYNPAKYENCDLLVHFKSKGELPLISYDLDTYHVFWIIERCDKDSLILASPINNEFVDNRSGNVYRYFVRLR